MTGKNNSGEDFERYASRDFNVLEYSLIPPCKDPDRDRDGLTDRWESLVGLDPNNPRDATGDPDNDGLDNTLEFFLGSAPL